MSGFAILRRIMSFLLSSPMTRAFALKKLEKWEDHRVGNTRYAVSWDLQGRVALLKGGSLCRYCQRHLEKGDEHMYCLEQLEMS